MRILFALAISLSLATPVLAADGGLRRFAIVAGASDGGPSRATLRYSTSDARQVARLLRRLGGVAIDDLVLVDEPDAAALRAAIGKVAAETGRIRATGQRVELFLYFSGHSDETGLLLGKSQLPYADLRAELERVPADVRVAILDSCSSGAFTRTKGGVHRPPFLLDESSKVKGHAFLTSSAADEASQESERLKGSFFTHALLTGLRGAADASSDGVVTLQEAYQFAYRETLARTETTQAGPQHATYDIGLVGSGDVVMTDLRRADAVLVIPAALEGTVFVRNAAGQLVAELRKLRGAGVELALEEGRYDLRVALDRNVTSTSVELASSSRVVLDPKTLAAMPLEVTALRGDAPAPNAAEVPLALPSVPSVPAAVAAPAPGAAPVPSSTSGRASWAFLAGGAFVPQAAHRGENGVAVQMGIGTWLTDFVGIEASVGYHRIEGDTLGLLPALWTYSDPAVPTQGTFDVRDAFTVVPVEATLKLALPTARLRPYVLGGAGLEVVHFERRLRTVVPPYNPPWVEATADRVGSTDLSLGFHAGIGASLPIGPRLRAMVEGRYRWTRVQPRDGDQNLGHAIDLAGVRLTAGLAYTF